MSGYIYQKTASDKCLIIEPRQSMRREMLLPATWSHIRLGIAISAASTSDYNSAPTNESVTRTGYSDDFIWGIKTGGNQHPYETGENFIGCWFNSNDYNSFKTMLGSDYGATFIGSTSNTSAHISSAISNNGSVSKAPISSNQGIQYIRAGDTPTLSTNYAHIDVLDIVVSGTQVNVRATCDSARSDFSDLEMYNAISLATFPMSGIPVTSGAFWSVGETPDVNNFYLHNPFYHNRLRIHSYGYIVIA